MIGRIIAGRYRIVSQLGSGGMGSVWRAEHLALGSPVALKLIDESIANAPEALERFEREAPTLPESQRISRQRQLVAQDQEFQRKQREFQEDLNQRKNEELSAVVDRANRVIRQIFETEKYDLIVQDAVHWSPRIDITDKVIRALNGPTPAPATK